MKKNQTNYLHRLHRLVGQLTGVEKLVTNNAAVADIIQQIEAVRGSLRGLEKELLSEKIKKIKDADLKQAHEYLLKL
ncbi:MAG: metal-sensitive transcriptional regulator [Patescibacteria group bacterium]|nr:metal-sensitive transcriptional regulator [Patescibacteria group bacterium]